MLKFLTILFCATLIAPALSAETEYVTRHSFSKQFVVYGPSRAPANRANRVSLDPALLAVSCERIKQAVLLELNGSSRWQRNLSREHPGKIYVVLHPGTRQKVIITPIRNTQLLSYRIDLPNQIEPAHLIEAVTQATLLELANRRSVEHFAHVPRWLAHGISERIQASSPKSLVLEAHQTISITKKHVNNTAKIRQELERYEPLTFEELSWPEDLPADRARHFDSCAQLFVHELLRLENGGDCLRKFLEELPDHLNWQIAFLRAFQPHFQQLVDVEKWWSLQLVNLTGRDAAQRWSRAQSLEKIDAALRVPVQVYFTNTLPNAAEVTLQKVLLEWEPEQQKTAVARALNQLSALRPRVQPEFVPLIDEYCLALNTHLQQFDRGLLKRVFNRENSSEINLSVRSHLDSLDKNRIAMRKPRPSTREEAILSALEVAGQTTNLRKQ